MPLPDISLAQAALVALVACLASILGGLAGYGTGLVLPVVLAPVLGVANVVPVMAVAMLINNASRVAAFRRDVQWPHVRRILWLALPPNVGAAVFYTRLEARTIALLLGLFLLASLPLRAWLKRRGRTLGPRGEVLAGGAFGLVNGTLSGTGVILISTLMAAGVTGPALIAADAVVSVVLELAKVAVFGGFARLDAPRALAGLLVGLCTTPGAFVARQLLDVIPPGVHARVMEAVGLVGACGFLWRAFR